MLVHREIKSKETWENFLLGCKEKTFLQSWNWGEFQKKMGRSIWRIGLYEGSELVSVSLVIKIPARRATFLLVPHGPVARPGEKAQVREEILHLTVEETKKLAKKEKANFVRFSPIWERNEENNLIFDRECFIPAPIHTHPEASWKLDISAWENTLLMNMRKSTRYLVRQGLRDKYLEVFQSEEVGDIEIFEKIYQKVVKAQKFSRFSTDYLNKEFLSFLPDKQICLFFSKFHGEYVASAFVIFWSKIGFYHHAALSPRHHRLPASYLLQWEAIKEAKRRGCVLYDFWGYVNPVLQKKHPWAGPTFFKMGFGGQAREYVKTKDVPLSLRYWPVYFFEKARKKKRRL